MRENPNAVSAPAALKRRSAGSLPPQDADRPRSAYPPGEASAHRGGRVGPASPQGVETARYLWPPSEDSS